MTQKIIIRPKASKDLERHCDYIAEHNLKAALRFFDLVRSTIAQIARTPGIGRSYSMKHPLLQGLRKWSVKGFRKYLIFYFEHDDTVEIVRILHAAQDISSILEDI